MKVYGCLWSLLFCVCAVAQTAPPAISAVNPPAIQRGTLLTIDVEGTNLRGASKVLFDAPGFQATVVHVTELPPERTVTVDPTEGIPIPPPPRHQVRLEVRAAGDTEPGAHRFRLQTPLGVTNVANLYVTPYIGEIGEAEPNDDPTEPQKVEWLPGVLVGSLSRPGDLDYFQFKGRGGQQIVFESISAQIGSQISATLKVLDEQGETLASSRIEPGRRDPVLGFTVPRDGKYLLLVGDYENRGGRNFFYRVLTGEFPYITSVFPLGVGRGISEVEVQGFNVGGSAKLKVDAPQRSYWGETMRWRPETSKGPALNTVRLAVGAYTEALEKEPNNSTAAAQMVTPGTTINGRVAGASLAGTPQAGGDEDFYRFRARKGQKLTFEVEAQRLGSLLDSVIEVLDSSGKPVPRATVRAVHETAITLNDPDSLRGGMRLQSCANMETGDLLMVGNEIVEVFRLPFGPDDDIQFKSFRGTRVPVLETTASAHAVNAPVYKVQVHPAGATFPPNGLPVFTVNYQNDDGGPMFGKDSRLTFEAPADGEYFLRLRDVRGLEGQRFAYRLTIREPSPDFVVVADATAINVPRGGRVPVTITAVRFDGFDGPIDVSLEDLPPGVSATKGTIQPGQQSTVLLVSAEGERVAAEPASFKVVGKAQVPGAVAMRESDPEDKLRFAAVSNRTADLIVAAEPAEVVIEPGKTATVTVKIQRANGFQSRVQVLVQNLPVGVVVKDFGLNGVLIPEGETSRTFTLEASPRVQPVTQHMTAVGTVETQPARSDYASVPLVLKVKASPELARR